MPQARPAPETTLKPRTGRANVVSFVGGILVLLGAEILRVYFIMPFPGSQRTETVRLAYFIHDHLLYFRAAGLLAVGLPLVHAIRSGGRAARWTMGAALALYGLVFYLFNFQLRADKIFYEPRHKVFADAATNRIPGENLVLGVTADGAAKAYPIEIIGYHHQVRDTVGATPVMITYCTVCRTGRVFSPVVDGQPARFRLVGMDQFNAMFEDDATKSWWRQVNGVAVAGPLRGSTLAEIPSAQMRLDAWIRLHPHTLVLQPDTTFAAQYEGMGDYDEGLSEGPLTRADRRSWQDKSWVVGVEVGQAARAYDWNDLARHRVLHDTLGGMALVVTIEPDSASFHVWRRDSLRFTFDPSTALLRDAQTGSTWRWDGTCVAGPLQGRTLARVQSYQEFWHSWRTFHPHTSRYTAPE